MPRSGRADTAIAWLDRFLQLISTTVCCFYSQVHIEDAMEAAAESDFCIFNICEGILWIGIAIGFAAVFYRRRENLDLMLASGLLFLSFGLSDFVEIKTGGWYKPWWMLGWKGATLLGFVVVYVLFRKRRPKGSR
jgi:hypothetical protein